MNASEIQRGRSGYGSIDGVIVPVEEEWRELKVGCWYEVKSRQGKRRTQEPGECQALRAEQMRYYCDFANASEFGEQVWASGCAAHADTAQEVVFVADGAAWIGVSEHYFPDAVQIVDWYHAVGYLSPLFMPPLAQTTAKAGLGSSECAPCSGTVR